LIYQYHAQGRCRRCRCLIAATQQGTAGWFDSAFELTCRNAKDHQKSAIGDGFIPSLPLSCDPMDTLDRSPFGHKKPYLRFQHPSAKKAKVRRRHAASKTVPSGSI
jgi:hypothetical protein